VRILFVQYTSDWTGPSKSLALLARGLVGKHELLAALPGRGELGERLAEYGVDVFEFPSITKWQLPHLARLVRREGVDLVYANDTNSTSRIAAIAARLGGAGFLCHVRSMGWGKSRLRMLYLWSADAVIAVSRACAESVERFVRRRRLHVVYNGVPDEELGPATEDDRRYLRHQIGASDDAVVVMSLAHLCERKGQLHAVRALEELRAGGRAVDLCLVGSCDREPGYVQRIRDQVRQVGLGGRVHLLGFRADAARLVRGADLFVHTALADPHPRAVVEAMAAARPVVAFAVDGVSETVLDGRTGRLVRAKDHGALAAAIRELLDEPERARNMGDAGRRRVVSTFTEGAATEGVLEVLDGLASARTRNRHDPLAGSRT